MTKLLTNIILRIEEYLSKNSLIRQFSKKYPRVSRFVGDRFSRSSFTGLTLTILLIFFIVSTMILAEIAENVVESESIVQVDSALSQYLFSHRLPILVKALYAITFLGSIYSSWIVGGLYSIVMFIRRQRVYAYAMWIVLLGMGVSIHLGKMFFQRARPVDIAYYLEDTYSFPSGHSTTAMALFGFILYTILQSKTPFRIVYVIALSLIILLVGLSRMYLGVHFLSDVISGFLLGFLWVIFGISLVEWSKERKGSPGR